MKPDTQNQVPTPPEALQNDSNGESSPLTPDNLPQTPPIEPETSTFISDNEPALSSFTSVEPSPAQNPSPIAIPDSSSPFTSAPVVPIENDTPSASEPSPVVAPTTIVPPLNPTQDKPKRSMMRTISFAGIGVIVFITLLFGTYTYGNNHGYTDGKNAQVAATAVTAIKVPANATMIAQCSAGEGTQYVLPSNIPKGPIYNVWNNKVTGIEYMLAQSEIAAVKAQNIALMGQQYNHVDVMYEAAGHAGFTEPHYHVIFSLISFADEQKITCGSSSSTMMQ